MVQKHPAIDESAPAIVIVAAPQVLRRALLTALLPGWARTNGISLREATPDGIAGAMDGGRCALVILDVGGIPVREGPAQGWIGLARQASPGAPVAVLSDLDRPEEIVAALRAGAAGFVPSSTDPELALHAFSFILHGGSYFPPGGVLLGRGAADGPRGGGGPVSREAAVRHRPAGLTSREQAILAQLREGRSNKLIGRLLGMQEATVKVHVRRILRKLGVANRTQAALAASAVLCTAEPPSGVAAFRLEVLPRRTPRPPRLAPPAKDVA